MPSPSTSRPPPRVGGTFARAEVTVRKRSPGYPAVFFQGTDYTTAARVAVNYAWKQGARRMAFFYCSTSAFCTDPVDGAKTFLAALGGTEIGRDLYLELSDDAAAFERKVVQFFRDERAHQLAHPDYAPVDWIWFGNTSPNTALLGRALKKAREASGRTAIGARQFGTLIASWPRVTRLTSTTGVLGLWSFQEVCETTRA